MNRTPDPLPQPASSGRPWLGWVIVAVAAVGVGASFVLRSDDAPAEAKRKGGHGRATPVSAAAAVRGPITQRGRYPGELTADTTDVAAFYAGRVADVKVRVGDTVAASQVVAMLDPVDAREQIAQARAQAKAAAAEQQRAQVERDQAAAEVTRLEPLARDQLISALEIDRQRARASALAAAVDSAEASEAEAKARVRLLERRVVESAVRAPFAGRVAARYVDPGAVVSAGTRLVRIVQVAPLRVRFEVPERDVGRLAAGTPLRVTTQAGAGTDHPGGVPAKVSGVASEVSRERRVATVEALLDETPAGWLPGMFAEATVELRTLADVTLVPSTAMLSRLQPDGTVVTGVFVARGGAARWVPAKEITRDGDVVAIEADVAAGAQVLIAGHVDLADGSAVAVSGARPEQGSAGTR